jgi:group I intron endonuclease
LNRGIYVIQNLINHKIYIGSAIDLKRRWNAHILNLRKNDHCNVYLQNAWNKYGEENFIFWILEVVKDKAILFEREQFYLNLFQTYSFGIYNVCLAAGGGQLGVSRSQDAKMKIGLAQKGNSHALGYKHTVETKRKIGIAARNIADETRRKISEASKVRRHTEESKRKLSEAHKGKVLSEEHKAKISTTLKNKRAAL